MVRIYLITPIKNHINEGRGRCAPSPPGIQTERGKEDRSKSGFLDSKMLKKYLTWALALLLNACIFMFFYIYLDRTFPLNYKDKQIFYLEKKYAQTKDVNTLLDMAWVYYEKGDIETAQKLVFLAMQDKNAKYNTTALYIDAFLKYKTHNYIGSKEQIEKLLSITKGKHEMGLYLLAQINYEQKEFDKALNAINQAITLNPLSGDLFFLRAKIYIEKNEINKARQDIERTLQFLPDHKDAKRLYSQILGGRR